MANGWYQLENGRARHSTTRAAGFPTPPILEPRPPLPVSPPRPPEPLPTAVPVPPLSLQKAVSPAHHSETVGPSGPVLIEDLVLHETLDDFVHSTRPQRVVHVKGWGALGFFQSSRSMAECTCLPFLQEPGVRVSVAARFSLAVSTRGTPDTARNVRGFSVKFYTREGVFDLLCNHLPVFLVKDAIRFPEAIRALLPAPDSNLLDPNRFWSFVAGAPEAMHFVVRLYSDAGTVGALRHLRGYGVNTYVWRNAAGVRRYVKYHWLPLAGEEYLTAQEAATLACQDPDYAGRGLWDSLRQGRTAEYELAVQLMDLEEVECLPFDPLDDTKVWDEGQFPLVRVGKLTLDKNPEDYLAQVENLAFSPSNLLPGAELSDDKMLQGRSFVYYDAQRHRLGPDFRKLPINAQGDWSPERQVTSGLGLWTQGPRVRAGVERGDDFSQAGAYYESLDEAEQASLARNVAAELPFVDAGVRRTVLELFHQVSPRLEEQILGR